MPCVEFRLIFQGRFRGDHGKFRQRKKYHAQPAWRARPAHRRKIHSRRLDVSTLNDDELSGIRNKLIGFVFQSYNLIPQYTVLENIEVPLLYRNGGSTITAERS